MGYLRYLSLLLGFCFSMPLLAVEVPQAHHGVLDLSDWDFARDGKLKIKGEWLYFPEKLFSREEILQETFQQTKSINISSGQDWQERAGTPYSVPYASFVMKIQGLSKASGPLALSLDQFAQQHQTWLYRPLQKQLLLLGESGKLATEKSQWIPQMKPVLTALPDLEREDIYLIILSSRFFLHGPFTIVPELDHRDTLIKNSEMHNWQTFFVLGMFCLLFISNLGLYALRPEDKPSLLIAIFALVMGIRYFSTESLLSRFIPEASWTLFALTIVPIGWCLSIGLSLYFQFFNLSFPGSLSKLTIRLNWIMVAGIAFVTFIFPPQTGTLILFVLVVQGLVSLKLVYSLIQLARLHVRGAGMALSGFGLLFLCMFNDACVGAFYLYDSMYLGHFGMIGFIICQSLVVGSNFAQAFRTAERLTKNLQQEVHQQTEKLRMQKEKLEEQKRILEDQKKQLLTAHEELKDADEQKTKFFRSISHELRTPLTLILGSLREQLNAAEMPAAVDMARRNAKRLFRLVNQLLDFQKIALAKFKIRLEPIAVNLFIENIAAFFTQSSEKRKISFQVRIDPSAQQGLKIMGQIDALEKIVFNYLANALKYTPKGGVIELILERRAQQARIIVTDSGPGIPEDQQVKLFKLFSQVEGRHQQDKQGTGLGLALVKELAQLMQGTVGVESHGGEGARFWVEFPLVLEAGQSIDILLVDSESKRAALLIQQFEERGHHWHIRPVTQFHQAVEVLQKEGARVVLTLVDAGPELNAFLQNARQLQPSIWRILLAEAGQVKQDSLKQLNTAEVDHFQMLPFSNEFWRILEEKLQRPLDQTLPILDLVYVEDEANIRSEFTRAMERHTVIQQYRIVADGEGLKKLLRTHRIRLVIADANLQGEQGTDLLAFVAGISPDTFRIILTGETSAEVMAEGIGKAHAHHILYKPCDYRKEMKLIEDYIRRSPISIHAPEEVQAGEDRDWHFAGLDQRAPDLVVEQKYVRPEACKAVILVVDDISDMRGIVGGMLRAQQYHVLSAESGQHALTIIKKYPQLIDLIVTDWLMPGMDGPELINALHEHEETASIPTILLTAKTDMESKAEGIRIGASAYLGKPFDSMELFSTVENLLDLKKRERKIEDLNQFINNNILQRFLPPDLVKDLLAGKAIFDDTARLRPITVMFADLCNFTRSTEILGPANIARILNEFFIRMTDVIFDHGGTIDKFMGDGILIIFGAPQSMENQEQIRKASQCAKAMQIVLQELNRSWLRDYEHQFEMRIGIHHGPAIVGSFGGKRRSDYTAIGNTVNIAARVESQAEPGQILMTTAVCEHLDKATWMPAGLHKLKGVENEVQLFALVLNAVQDVA